MKEIREVALIGKWTFMVEIGCFEIIQLRENSAKTWDTGLGCRYAIRNRVHITSDGTAPE
jgi:hypothetical protein